MVYRMDQVVKEALKDLLIGETRLRYEGDNEFESEVRRC